MRAFCCLAALTTFATAAQAEATKYPLTLDNCGVEVTFDKAPATTVSLGQTATEILYSLDLADKVAGTGVWFSDVLPEFAERVLPVDTVVAQRCARLHVPDRRDERDALIAATALVHGMTVVTRNRADFEPTGVGIVNPWEPLS